MIRLSSGGLSTFNLTTMYDNYTAEGFYLLMYSFSAAEHGGTHIDAPRHFAEGKWTTDQIPLDRLIGPAIKIDISSKAAQVKCSKKQKKETFTRRNSILISCTGIAQRFHTSHIVKMKKKKYCSSRNSLKTQLSSFITE